MRKFTYLKIKNIKLDSQIQNLIREIYRYRGQEEVFLKLLPNETSQLVTNSVVQSVQYSNEIEGISTTNYRLKKIIEEKIKPVNRNEKEIAGYRDVLSLINENYQIIDISKNHILQLHGIMLKRIGTSFSGHTKNVQNYISITYANKESEVIFTPLSPFETPIALDGLCSELNKAISDPECDPLLVIFTFIHDFLCIHPFNDGNGRISRLLTNLLLLKTGFHVAKYQSIEKIIAETSKEYYSSLFLSGKNWHEEKEDSTHFIKYMLTALLVAYRDFTEKVLLIDTKSSTIDYVKKAVKLKLGRFSKQDIVYLCPGISLSSIEGALRKLVKQGELKREGKGRSIKYINISKTMF